jgi:mono/diheme cytochrome c family protein
MNTVEKYYPWFAVLGITIAILVLLGYFKDENREWKYWQREYIQQEIAAASTEQDLERAMRIPVEIRQILPVGLDRVDRCTSCHLAVEDPLYDGKDQPLAYHPNHSLHPIEKFGCTVCHRGQGRATEKEAAHGHVKHWEEPMLSTAYIEASCAKCHAAAGVPGASRLVQGARLFEEQGCIGCHKLRGSGLAIGPDLDRTGLKHSPEWLVDYLKHPGKILPGSNMPAVKLEHGDLEALALFLLGQTGEILSEYHVSRKILPAPETGRRIFNQRGCVGCHSIDGTGGTVGPDLKNVVQRRSMDWIIDHFVNPQAMSPGTVMPMYNFSQGEILALSGFLTSLADPTMVTSWRETYAATPEVRGRAVYLKYGCGGCHGPDGKGGVPNPNADPDEAVPPVMSDPDMADIFIESYILEGIMDIAKLDPDGPAPPIYMPPWEGVISETEIADLISYLRTIAME